MKDGTPYNTITLSLLGWLCLLVVSLSVAGGQAYAAVSDDGLHTTPSLLTTGWQGKTEAQLLELLDEAVAHRQQYFAPRIHRIDSLEQCLHQSGLTDSLRYALFVGLFHENNSFNIRTTVHYAQQCAEIAQRMQQPYLEQQSRIFTAQSLIKNGLYNQAEQLLVRTRSNIVPEQLNEYYKTCIELYGWKSQGASTEKERNQYQQVSIHYRDSALMTETDPIWHIHQQGLLWASDSLRIRDALHLVTSSIHSLPLRPEHIRHLAHSAGVIYQQLGNADSARYYWALSALYDLTDGVREHLSLYNLALCLFRKENGKETERAYHYLRCSVNDATDCEVPLRVLQFSPDFPIILDAYQQKIDNQNHQLHRWLTAFIVLSALLVAALLYVHRMSRRLRQSRKKEWQKSQELEANNLKLTEAIRQEQAANLQLREANRIKVAYVTQYMTECSHFIEKMDTYRKQLLHLAQSQKTTQLLPVLRDNQLERQELNNFYNHFDKTFIGLFPHFVEDLNALLQPDARFDFRPDLPRLNTDLRVFALIRLGITDSTTIATFLHCSVKTVYNCRARLRSKAIGDRNEFEQQLKRTGQEC